MDLKNTYHRIAARIVSIILRPAAAYLPENFDLWEQHNYHILPIHFYSPVPDTRVLCSSDLWTRQRDLFGIDWNLDFQIELLTKLFPFFWQEFVEELQNGRIRQSGFNLDNDSFTGIDPAVLYAFVRHYKPQQILEIGSGNSSRIITAALTENGSGELISVDPYPSDLLISDLSGLPHRIIQARAEELPLSFFNRLDFGDVLFIDSTHTVRTGGDVNFIFLEVLPHLKPGVLVHVHDITLPYEYPRELLLDRHIFWSEQYLLHAFILFNETFEILMANTFLERRYPDLLKRCFPGALWYGGTSFWMRRIPNDSSKEVG